MAQILKMLHLSKQDGVSEMQIGSGRVETRLYPQRASEREALAKILFANALGQALFQVRKLLVYRGQTLILVDEPIRTAALLSDSDAMRGLLEEGRKPTRLQRTQQTR